MLIYNWKCSCEKLFHKNTNSFLILWQTHLRSQLPQTLFCKQQQPISCTKQLQLLINLLTMLKPTPSIISSPSKQPACSHVHMSSIKSAYPFWPSVDLFFPHKSSLPSLALYGWYWSFSDDIPLYTTALIVPRKFAFDSFIATFSASKCGFSSYAF